MKGWALSRPKGRGRHRRHRARVTVPMVTGSVIVATAASGALVMPHASGVPHSTHKDDDAPTGNVALGRPMASSPDRSGALETVTAAGQSLSEQTTQSAKTAHDEIVQARERAAAQEAARREREAKKWLLPLTSPYRLTAQFGDTSGLWSTSHTGLDFAAEYGDSVRAASSGEITFAGWDGAYGYKVEIRHWDGTVTWYAHLSRIVQTSGTVAPGTVIGQVGATGNVTGPHLHLEVRPGGGEPVDPATWLAERGISL